MDRQGWDFPSDFVPPLRLNFSSLSKDKLQFYPPHISWNDLKLKEVIGAGGFGKVYRCFYRNIEVAVKAVSEKGAQRVAQRVVRFPNCHECHFQ